MPSLKRVLFSITHLGSGSLPLLNILNQNPRVQFSPASPVVHNYTDLQPLTATPHKMTSVAAMYAFEIAYNYQFGTRNPVRHAHHLFVVRQPEAVLTLLVSGGYGREEAARYYCYRLRRICEIAKRVEQGMLLTFDDLQRGEYGSAVKTFLGLKDEPAHAPEAFESLKPSLPCPVSQKTLDWCQDCYERHLFFLKSLPLAGVNHG